MNCPQCNMDAPDNNYRCPHCGEVLRPDSQPSDFIKAPGKKSGLNTKVLILAIIVLGLAVLIYAVFLKGKGENPRAHEPAAGSAVSTAAGSETATAELTGAETGSARVEEANAENDSLKTDKPGEIINAINPGEEIDIKHFIRTGKTTIIDFYSEYCPPCRKISPLLKQLDSQRQDIVVYKVDINRPGTRGIDWTSPLAQQYGLRSIPHFQIYDSSGQLKSEGREAYSEIIKLLQGENII